MSELAPLKQVAADMLTAGQFAPEGGFLGRVPRLQSNIQRQTFSKICEEQLHLNTALVSTRACGYFLFKKRKKLLKNRVPENGLTHRRRSFFQDLLKILLSKHRMVSAFEAGADAAR